jgi:hypothetical protein
MHSSISPSRHTFLVLVVSLVISYLTAAAYTLYGNPELNFWKEAYRQKMQWASDLTAKGLKKYVFVGGSSCAFQVDAGLLTNEYDLPSVNMGMHAGMGSLGVTALGLQALEPGDTLVLAIEPGLLAKPPVLTPLGYQMLISTGLLFRSGIHQSLIGEFAIGDILGSLRPGLYNITTMLAKFAVGRKAYRYSLDDILSGGALKTDFRERFTALATGSLHLEEQSRELLKTIKLISSKQDAASVTYLMPVILFEPEAADTSREVNVAFLVEIGAVIETVDDPTDGVSTRKADFADTALHLTGAAMNIRTKEVAEILDTPAR